MMLRPLTIAVLVLAPSLAAAQGLAGPFGGLFGRTPERTGQEFTALEFRSAVGGQYDAAIADDSRSPESVPQPGTTSGVNAGLTFERRGDRLRLRLNGIGANQQFYREPAFTATTYDTGALLAAQVATRLAIDATAGYRRSPFFHLPVTSAVAVPLSAVLLPGDAYAARRLDNETAEGMVGFTNAYTKHSTLTASVSRRTTRFFTESENNFGVWGVQGTWRRKLSRDLGAHVGYGREEVSQAVGAGQFVHETIDVGLDLAREMSLARRTGLTFNTQTSMVREAGGDRRYRLNGTIALTRGFRRTWAASLAANRNTEFLPGFLQPVFTDGVSGSLAGMLAKRIEWTSAVGASRGRIGFEAPEDFTSYFGQTRLSAGVTRYLGLHAEYVYYRYDLPPGANAVVLLPQLSRQSVSFGISAYVPIFTKVRAPRDPR